MAKVLLAAFGLLICFGAGVASADEVSYTNAELTAMAEAGVVANKRHESTTRLDFNNKYACQVVGGITGLFHMEDAYLTKETYDTEGYWELQGWSRNEFRKASCLTFSPDMVNVKYQLMRYQYTWKSPKWSPDDD